MSVRIGQLRDRIEIQERTETRDAHGGVVPDWITKATRWGSVGHLSERQALIAQQTQSDADRSVRLRYYSGLTTRHRLHLPLTGRVLNIVGIDNKDNRNWELEVTCKEDTT